MTISPGLYTSDRNDHSFICFRFLEQWCSIFYPTKFTFPNFPIYNISHYPEVIFKYRETAF